MIRGTREKRTMALTLAFLLLCLTIPHAVPIRGDTIDWQTFHIKGSQWFDVPTLLLNTGETIPNREIHTKIALGPLLFDPNTDAGSLRSLPGKAIEGQYLVQFSMPPEPGVIERLTDRHFRIVDIVSASTVLVESPKGEEPDLKSIPGIRAFCVYHPLMKVEGGLFNKAVSDEGQGSIDLVIGLYSPLDTDTIEMIIDHSENTPVLDTMDMVLFGRFQFDDILELASIPEVSHVSLDSFELPDNDVAGGIIDVIEASGTLGLNGSGQIVAVCDTGLDTGSNSTMHEDIKGRIVAAYAYGRSNNWSDADIHTWKGTGWDYDGGHGTHVIGSVLGNGSASSGKYAGMAPKAELVVLSTMTSSGSLSVPSYRRFLDDSYNNGARIETNSWSTSSTSTYANYTWRSWQIDNYIWGHKNLTVLFSAGNRGDDHGDHSISTQSSSKNVISVGASESYRPNIKSSKGTYSNANNVSQIADFSSQGYTWTDSRIKPDVVAPGTWILSTRSMLITDKWNHYWGDNVTYSGVNNKYAYMGGTSMSTPIVSGMAALIRQAFEEEQYHDDPSAALVKAAVINGARPLDDDWSSVPNRFEGWGRVNISNSLGMEDSNAGVMRFIDNSSGLSTGSTHSRMYSISSNSKDLVATLVWTDYPGSNTSSTKLVNDLDFEVTTPNGTKYYGNDLTSPYNSSRDRKNNVERIRIPSPAPGIYRVNVTGYSVTQGTQPYALVMTGSFTDAVGKMEWEESIVPANGSKAHVILSDSNMTGSGWVHVKVNTTGDPTGETLNLTEINQDTEPTGIFRGSVAVVNSQPGPGEVHVSGDDRLVAHYEEQFPRRTLTAETSVLLPPSIGSITHDSEGRNLTYRDEVVVTINGTKGMEVWFDVLNLTSVKNVEAKDDGVHPDPAAGDGNYTGIFSVPNLIVGNYTVRGYIKKEQLHPQNSDCDSLLHINTNLPKRPENLTVSTVQSGNTLKLEWDAPEDPNLMAFEIYRANESFQGSMVPEIFEKVHRTTDNKTHWSDTGLIDGNRYFYRVSSFNLLGYLSDPTAYVSGVPADTSAPWFRFFDPEGGEVLSGEVELNYSVEKDSMYVQFHGALDSGGDGVPDSPWYMLTNDTSTADPGTWNTTDLPSGLMEGTPIMIRAQMEDEAGNINITGPLTTITVDNSAPGFIDLTSENPSVLNISVYRLVGRTEPNCILKVKRDDSEISRGSSTENGSFQIFVPLKEGNNELELLVLDHLGNGPTIYGEEILIIYDPLPPKAVFGYGEAFTSSPFVLDASSSFDPGPETGLTGISNYSWTVELGDGIWTGYGRTVALRSDAPGEFRVKLVVTDTAGNKDICEGTVSVLDDIPPRLGGIEDVYVNEDHAMIFEPSGVWDNDPAIILHGEYLWSFKGPVNISAAELESVVTFEVPGFYNASLSVTDSGGGTAQVFFNVTVIDVTQPNADAGPDKTMVLGTTIVLNGDNSTDNDPLFPDKANHTWTITNLGIVSYGPDIVISPNLLGRHRVVLKVVDGSGNMDIDEMYLTVVSDGSPPNIVHTTPGNGWSNVTPGASIKLLIDEAVDPSSSTSGIHLSKVSGELVPISVRTQETMITVTPLDDLEWGGSYSLTVDGLADVSGERMDLFEIVFSVVERLRIVDIEDPSGSSTADVGDLGFETGSLPVSLEVRFNTEVSWDMSNVSSRGPDGRKGPAEFEFHPSGKMLIVTILEGTDGTYSIDLSGIVSSMGYGLTGPSMVNITYLPSEDDGGSEPESDEGLPVILFIAAGIIVVVLIVLSVVILLRRGGDKGSDNEKDREAPDQGNDEHSTDRRDSESLPVPGSRY